MELNDAGNMVNIVGADLCIGPIQNNKNNIIDNKNHINTGENIVSPLQYMGKRRK